jgi:GH25 family lysozyme M1 (1,4-beta-N-acetylmuramidase)
MSLKGIDISEHNGYKDWNRLKADGVQFAMIRLGYGSDQPSQDDKMFQWYVSEAERVGIKWGAYLYSYALTVEDAKSELQHIKRVLNGRNPSFPVGFDMEDADGYKAKKGMPSNDTLVSICDTVLNGIEGLGHYAILYASLDWLNHQLKSPKLDRYDKWVAQWAAKCDYTGKYNMWQYSNNAIDNLDSSIAYVDFSQLGIRTQKYRVNAGENLTVIAAKFHTDVNTLLKLNPNIKDENLIQVGQIITVPK